MFGNNAVVRSLGKEFLFEVLNVLAMQKFGKQLKAKDFGVYSPREHMDHPAGQFNDELLEANSPEARLAHTGKDQFTTPKEDISSPEATAKLFTVNEAGLPAYIGRSIQYVEEEFSAAADIGRNPDGLMHFGNGLHTVEDLFAHSNWAEIAVAKLIKDKKVSVGAETAKCMKDRAAEGKETIETLSARTKSGRPILTTGTFVLDDTLISLSEALSGFMKGFSPFSGAANNERTQQTMKLMLGRYQELAKDNKAGEVVKSFLSHLGPTLKDKLADAAREAIAGDPAAADAPWYKKGLASARAGAGALVGGAIKTVGGLMDMGWVQDLFATAANAFGKLPLVEIYDYAIAGPTNRVDKFFKDVDEKLVKAKVPGYAWAKAHLKSALDKLRGMVRAPIESAVKFVGESIQAAFAEARVSGTNTAKQIEKLKKEQIKNPALAKYLAQKGASPEAQIALLQDPKFCANARFDPNSPEAREAKAVLERLLRIQALEKLPPEVKAGPSHSQIAKDHADSPFFGTAVTMAGAAVTGLRDRMVLVWQSEGNNTQHSSLTENYSDQIPPDIRARRAPPGTPKDKMTPDQLAAENEFWDKARKAKNYKEIKSLEEGRAMMAQGGIPEAEVSHGGKEFVHGLHENFAAWAKGIEEFPKAIRDFATKVEGAAPAAAAELRSLASSIGRGVDGLAAEVHDLETKGTSSEAEALAERLHKLAKEKEALVYRAERVLRAVADQVEKADPALDGAATGLRRLAQGAEPLLTKLGGRIHDMEHKIKDTLVAELAGKEQRAAVGAINAGGGVATAAWAPELTASHGKPAKDATVCRRNARLCSSTSGQSSTTRTRRTGGRRRSSSGVRPTRPASRVTSMTSTPESSTTRTSIRGGHRRLTCASYLRTRSSPATSTVTVEPSV